MDIWGAPTRRRTERHQNRERTCCDRQRVLEGRTVVRARRCVHDERDEPRRSESRLGDRDHNDEQDEVVEPDDRGAGECGRERQDERLSVGASPGKQEASSQECNPERRPDHPRHGGRRAEVECERVQRVALGRFDALESAQQIRVVEEPCERDDGPGGDEQYDG